jgi:hypothetical protein
MRTLVAEGGTRNKCTSPFGTVSLDTQFCWSAGPSKTHYVCTVVQVLFAIKVYVYRRDITLSYLKSRLAAASNYWLVWLGLWLLVDG